MARATANTGAAGQLIMDAFEVAVNSAGNWSDVDWYFYLHERTQYNTTWVGSVSAAVDVNLDGNDWAGNFGFDWRPGGLQDVLIASGTTRVFHNPDGSKTVSIRGAMGATGTAGAGGPATVTLALGLTTLKVLPSVPTNVQAERLSDTQVRLTWTNGGASNGQPTQNIIQRRKNDGSWDAGTVITATTAATLNVAPNEKWEYRVAARNAAGTTAYSGVSTPVYTTPAAPSNVQAIKDAGLDINVTFQENIPRGYYNHEVWHGVVAGGVTTWDGSPLATLAAGVLSYTHVAPNAAQVHIYRVRAKIGDLYSGYVESAAVQLLAPPNKPTVPAMPSFADKAKELEFSWIHNPVDTTAQTAYEFAYSTNGGSSWTSTGKITSTVTSRVVAANTFAANDTVQFRVRTWGQATSGGSDGTGASPWSDSRTVIFKTAPTASIVSPVNGATLNDATLRVTIGFAQAEGATFVKGQLELIHDSATLELLETANLVGTQMATPVLNGETYTIRARVQDSNGLWSSWASHTFSVEYLLPVAPGVVLTYLEETGFAQIDLNIPEPEAGEDEAATVTVTRSINGGPDELVVQDYPAATEIAFMDTTPIIHGTNTYRITTKTALGAERTVEHELVTNECRRAFLSKGVAFDTVISFGANLKVNENLAVASDTIEAAGRVKPIGLYGVETRVQLKVSSLVFEREGFSTLPEIREFLLMPGKACFRDASGQRVFGSVKGGLSYQKSTRGDLSFTLTETS